MKGTRERQRRESPQRVCRSEGDTIENNDNETGVWGGRDEGVTGGGDTGACSHVYHPKETFIPHIKGAGTSCLKKSLDSVECVCVCSSLVKLAGFCRWLVAE